MDAEFLEGYDQLKDMKIGDFAVSKNRKEMYMCCWVPNETRTDSHKAVVRINQSHDQYIHRLNLNQIVKISQPGDRFVVTR